MGCARLEADTYLQQEVIAILNDLFIPVRVQTDREPDVAKEFAVWWTPAIVVCDKYVRIRPFVGYVPPGEFEPEVLMMRALWELRRGSPRDALERFQMIYREFPGAHVIAEAIYYEGVAAYRHSGNKDDLWAVWHRLVQEWPGSSWALRTTLITGDTQTSARDGS